MATYIIAEKITRGILVNSGVTSGGVPYNNTYTNLAYRLERTVRGPDLLPKRRKPEGYLYPTVYRHYGSDQCYYGVPNMYASYTQTSTPAVSMHAGVDTQNRVDFSARTFPSSVANKAIQNARSKMKGQHVNFGIAFAEAKQTASLVTNTATRIAKAVEAAKKGNLRGISRALGITRPPSQKAKTLAKRSRADYQTYKAQHALGNVRDYYPGDRSNAHNLFLEYQFGWKPMLSDVKGSMEHLGELHTGKDAQGKPTPVMPYVFAAIGTSTYGETLSPVESVGQAFGSYTARVTRRERYSYKCKVRLDGYLDNPLLHTLAQTGLVNPLSVVWEKVPWSFVVDWIVPVGKYLDTLDATVGWSFKSGSISRKVDGRCVMNWRSPAAVPPGYKTYSVSGYGVATQFDLDRQIYTSFPLPTLDMPKNPFTGNRPAKAISLLLQQFQRR